MGQHKYLNPITTKSPRIMEAEMIQKQQKKDGFPGVGKYNIMQKKRMSLGKSDQAERIGVISEA